MPSSKHNRLGATIRCQSAKAKGAPQAAEHEDVDDDGIIYLDGDSDDEEFGEEEADDEPDALISSVEDDPGPEILTGNVAWGDTALKVAREVLQQPELQGLDLYLFRVLEPSKTIDVRLDRLDDKYGSPSIDDLERFARRMAAALEQQLGAEAAGDIAVEVSSPGAERQLRIPADLIRFQGLPMRVEYLNDVGQLTSQILQFTDIFDDATNWKLADVKANAPTKGRGLSKRQREQQISIPLPSLERARIYVDF